MYTCARIKLTDPRYGCNLCEMLFTIHTGGSHEQEQDSEYDTRISNTREVHSRHRLDAGDCQEHGAQVFASPRAEHDTSPTAQSPLQAGSIQRADQKMDHGGSLLQLRGDVSTVVSVGLHREFERAQDVCTSVASSSRRALSHYPL